MRQGTRAEHDAPYRVVEAAKSNDRAAAAKRIKTDEQEKNVPKSSERIYMDDLTCSRESLSNSNSNGPDSAQGHRDSLKHRQVYLYSVSQTRPAFEQVAVRPLTPAESKAGDGMDLTGPSIDCMPGLEPATAWHKRTDKLEARY